MQFYKATSNGVVSDGDMADIAAQIARVYEQAGYVGSLVTDGDTGRPTEYDGPKTEPPQWWDSFWSRYEVNSGQSRDDAMAMLHELYGQNWHPAIASNWARPCSTSTTETQPCGTRGGHGGTRWTSAERARKHCEIFLLQVA